MDSLSSPGCLRESELREARCFLERSSVRIKLCTILYNYICIYITHIQYMGYIKRQKKEEYIREQLNQKKSGWIFPPLLPASFTLWLVKVPPPYGKPMEGKPWWFNPVIYFWLGGRHLVGPWSPSWMFPHHSFTSKYMCPFSERTDWKYGEKKSSFSKYIGHTYVHLSKCSIQNGMNSYPKKSTKNHLMGFFFIALRWGKAARCILFLIQSNRWLC